MGESRDSGKLREFRIFLQLKATEGSRQASGTKSVLRQKRDRSDGTSAPSQFRVRARPTHVAAPPQGSSARPLPPSRELGAAGWGLHDTPALSGRPRRC